MLKFLKKYWIVFFYVFIAGNVALSLLIIYYTRQLPNHKSLRRYNPPLSTRLYSGNGKFLKEYAKEKRVFVSINEIPAIVKEAFISAEDASFYENSGISLKGIVGAGIESVWALITGKGRVRGASTITQQVAKNFLLSNERTLTRKIKEVIIAVRLTKAFTKDQILELYLNQIFFGNRSYGIGAAALNYFDKSVDELTIEEAALLASLPKAPSQLDPTRNNNDNSDVLYRRNWIIGRMYDLGYITEQEKEKAINTKIILKHKDVEYMASGEFFSEEVRKQLQKLYGENGVMEDGNFVATTIIPKYQKLADKYLKQGIEEYDVRHGWRGAIDNIAGEIDFENRWGDIINEFKIEKRYRDDWEKAVVLDINVENENVIIGLKKTDDVSDYNLENTQYIKTSKDDKLLITGYIPLTNLTWAREYIDVDNIGKKIKSVKDVKLYVGDVIVVKRVKENEYELKQIPAVNGALVAMQPSTGNIVAMMGGYIDSQLDFNRVTQAERQPGSTIKTFAYLTALENGFTPASIVIDEEITLFQGEDAPPYRPKNTEGDNIYYGPTTLRVGLEKSRNVTTVRLASEVGIRKIARRVRDFGITNKPKPIYSLVLGSTETNLMRMVRAYAMIANGGKKITPILIEKIQDKDGNTIFKSDDRECQKCKVAKDTNFEDIIIPVLNNNKEEITDSATAYQMINMLVGAVQKGTAWRAKQIGKPIAAKTGTTNDGKDAWFIGFSPDLVAGVYVGFDKPDLLGQGEYGANVAGPIFVNFMKDALKDAPSMPFKIPDTVKLLKIDETTGYYPTPSSEPKNIVTEAFKLNEEPTRFHEDNVDEMLEQIDEYNTIEMPPEIVINIENKHKKNEEEATEIESNGYEIEYGGKKMKLMKPDIDE